MSVRWIAVAAALGMLITVASGCKRERAINGIDRWELNKTVKKQHKGRCDVDEKRNLTWCYGNPSLALGGQSATVDLYFDGTGDEAPLVQILLSIGGCNEPALKTWLQDKLGKTSASTSTRLYWEGKHAFIAALVPSDPARCDVKFVAPDQKGMIDAIWKE
jgi:hypothetical protein